jgi:hypothetical protein
MQSVYWTQYWGAEEVLLNTQFNFSTPYHYPWSTTPTPGNRYFFRCFVRSKVCMCPTHLILYVRHALVPKRLLGPIYRWSTRYLPSKRRKIVQQHSVTSQKTWILKNTAVTNWKTAPGLFSSLTNEMWVFNEFCVHWILLVSRLEENFREQVTTKSY